MLARQRLSNVTAVYRRLEDRVRVAEGTTAIVFKARLGETQLAVKEYFVTSADPGDAWARALEEIELLRSLESPLITKFAFGGVVVEGGLKRLVLATEFCSGETLSSFLRDSGALDQRERVRLAVSFLKFGGRTLRYLASRGIIHRDLKPENIFLVDKRRRRFKLLDFGLARRLDRSARYPSSWEVNAASRLRSPQKWVDFHEVDEKDEIWSIGVIAFLIVHGHYPFESRGASSSEDRLRELILYAPPKRETILTQDAVRVDRYLAWLLRKDSRVRPDVKAVGRSLRAAERDAIPVPETQGIVRRFLEVGTQTAWDLTKWHTASSELKVALICERIICVDSWRLRGPAVSRFFRRSVDWLSAARRSDGEFPSLTVGYGTTYCTAIALIALARIRSSLEDASTGHMIEGMISEAAEALHRSRKRNGWGWFVRRGATHGVASFWAALALSEIGEVGALHDLLLRTLDPEGRGSDAPDPAFSKWTRLSIALYAASRLAETGGSTVEIDRLARGCAEQFYSDALKDRLEVLENVRVDLPAEIRRRLRGIAFLMWTNPTAAMASYALFSYSKTDPFMLDGGLRLIEKQLTYLRKPSALTFVRAWTGIALSKLYDHDQLRVSSIPVG